MDALFVLGTLLIGFGVLGLFWWGITAIDNCYKAGCTLADPDGSRARARSKYYGGK